MKKNTLLLLVLAAGAYYLYSKSSGSGFTTPMQQTCKFPDGTLLMIPLGSSCPYDNARGGQAVSLGPCYPTIYSGAYVGPYPNC